MVYLRLRDVIVYGLHHMFHVLHTHLKLRSSCVTDVVRASVSP